MIDDIELQHCFLCVLKIKGAFSCCYLLSALANSAGLKDGSVLRAEGDKDPTSEGLFRKGFEVAEQAFC